MAERYDAGTALIVVDMQVDFGRPDGSLYVAGGEDTVAEVNAEIDAAEAANATIVYTQDWHPPDTPHFAKDGGRWPVHCVADTPGAEFLDLLRVVGPVVRKGTAGEDGYSGFSVRDLVSGESSATELGALLENAGVTRLVVVGLAGDYCVKETALDGRRLGYEVTVPLRAVRFVNLSPGDDAAATAQMEAAGVTIERDRPSHME